MNYPRLQINCDCGNHLKHQGDYEYWCDNIDCTNLYVLDEDCHIVKNGKIWKNKR